MRSCGLPYLNSRYMRVASQSFGWCSGKAFGGSKMEVFSTGTGNLEEGHVCLIQARGFEGAG